MGITIIPGEGEDCGCNDAAAAAAAVAAGAGTADTDDADDNKVDRREFTLLERVLFVESAERPGSG